MSSQTTDPEGRVTSDTFDALNRRTASIANFIAGGPQTSDTDVTTRWEYDLAGNIKKLTDGNGHATLFDYDQLNRKVREENAEARGHALRVQPDGRPAQAHRPAGAQRPSPTMATADARC